MELEIKDQAKASQPATQDFHVFVLEALRLHGKDLDNKSTPIVKMSYGSQSFATGKGIPEHTRNCIWTNSSSSFHKEESAKTLVCRVYARHHILEDKLIGLFEIDLSALPGESVVEDWFTLTKPQSKCEKTKNDRGKIHLLIYNQLSFPSLKPQKNGTGIFFPLLDQIEKMRTGDMLLFAGLGSKKICAASGSQYSHSALVLKPSDWDASLKPEEGQLFLTESTSNESMDAVTNQPRKGVAIRDFRAKVSKYNGYGVWYLPLKEPLEGKDLETFLAFVRDFHQRSVQYDEFQSKLRIAGKINSQDLNEVYCSEYVAEALQRANRIPTANASSNYLPIDLSLEPCFGPISLLKYLVYHKAAEEK